MSSSGQEVGTWRGARVLSSKFLSYNHVPGDRHYDTPYKNNIAIVRNNKTTEIIASIYPAYKLNADVLLSGPLL